MFKLEIETGNDAFGEYPANEVIRLLRDAADRLAQGEDAGRLTDESGNRVGFFHLFA